MCWQTLVLAYGDSHTATIEMIGKRLRGLLPARGRAWARYPGRMH